MPRVAIAHEWLVAYAGSERCVEQLLRLYPDAHLVTTVIDRESVPETLRGAEPSWLQHVPSAQRHHEWFLPLMPLSWRLRRPLEDVDIVISSSHACAKAVRMPRGVPHLCYCHTPMRYAWDFAAEQSRFPAAIREPARLAMRLFRRWDRSTAGRVTCFVANSTAVATRIRRFYRREARVVFPPVRTEFFTPDGAPGTHFLYVGRLVGYKSPEVLLDAFAGLAHQLLIVGEGSERARLERRAPENVKFLGRVDDEELRGLYRSARAFVYPVDEDFGIAMAEAQACGAPVIALDAGGARDIVDDGRTGRLVGERRSAAFRRAILEAATTDFDRAEIAASAQRYAASRFRAEIEETVDELIVRRSTG
jgi:glycosyltransferase involved in cell wall biosynthesis